MKRLAVLFAACLVFVLSAGTVLSAMPGPAPVVNTKAPNNPVITIPAKAVELAPNVFSLGNAIDSASGQVVEGYMIVHPKKTAARGGAAKSAGGTTCYTYLAKYAKWKSVEPWIMNPSNSRLMDTSTVYTIMQEDVALWNTAAGATVLGDGTSIEEPLAADSYSPDDKNEVYFGSISDRNTIAVTIVWGIFSGNAAQRVLVEWDMVFDDQKFDWSTTGELTKMDFDNIATHELGHAAGLGDLYNSCTDETMFGYSTEGETKKRDLNPGDIQGISTLY